MKKHLIYAIASIAIAAVALCSCSKEKEIPAEKITIEKEEVKILLGHSVSFNYSISPANATEKVTFSSDNADVAIIDAEGNITVKGAGIANITVRCGSASASFKLMVFSNTFSYAGKIYPIDHCEVYITPEYGNFNLSAYNGYSPESEEGEAGFFIQFNENYYNGKEFDLTKRDPLLDDENYDEWYYYVGFETDDTEVEIHWGRNNLPKSGTSYVRYDKDANELIVNTSGVDCNGNEFSMSFYEVNCSSIVKII